MKHLLTVAMLFALIVAISVDGSNLPASDQPPALSAQDHDSCIVDLTGDVNVSGSVTAADIIAIINEIFLEGPGLQPCRGAGDVDCSGSVTSADVIYLVFYVFKSGIEPCDICESEEAFNQNCIQ